MSARADDRIANAAEQLRDHAQPLQARLSSAAYTFVVLDETAVPADLRARFASLKAAMMPHRAAFAGGGALEIATLVADFLTFADEVERRARDGRP